MNKKLFTLLALASFSNMKAVAETACAPEVAYAAQNGVMLVGASLGVASMKDPISARTDWNAVTPLDGKSIANGLPTDVPVGYQSNISNLVASAAKMGFAGRLDVQYGMRQGMFGAFLYAGIGLNQSKTTSNAMSINNSRRQNSYSKDGTKPYAYNGQTDPQYVVVSSYAPTPNPRVTITSGLNFQAGARMGVWVNNMFFHGIVGWQCLNLQSKVSNVYKPFEREYTLQIQTKVDGENVTPVANITTSLGNTKLGTLSSFTKNKWTNALVLGAGLDFAHQKWTYGFYYQAAICQRTNFKYDNFVVGATQNVAVLAVTDSTGKVTQIYGKSPVTVSIAPVISTFMMTVKYAFHKA
jgi:hypothetical protein